MNMMKYKGYAAHIEFDEEDRIFVGHLAGIKDIVGFHGTTVNTLEKAFHESVENYLAISEETGRQASEKPDRAITTDRSAPLSQIYKCIHHHIYKLHGLFD